MPKADLVAVARVAGIMAAKRTPDLIPLCHPLQLTGVEVPVTSDHASPGVQIEATVRTIGKISFEMEALTVCHMCARPSTAPCVSRTSASSRSRAAGQADIAQSSYRAARGRIPFRLFRP